MTKIIATLGKVNIRNTSLEHAQSIYDTVRLAYYVPLDEDCDGCLNEKAVRLQLERFPEGQFVATLPDESGERIVVGSAHTMRTNYPPTDPPLTWMEMIGSRGIERHEPDGDWLYGVEMVVRPNFRRRGIGSALYKARFNLVRQLNLKGWYAVGMLMGYHRYRDVMSVVDYGNAVINGEMRDPTVSMQINRGFTPMAIVENYLEDEEDADNCGVLIVWNNPDYAP